jgi:hypothetical protein
VKRTWLFVGGLSRSGTTLMARLLSLHPEAWVSAECGWVLNLLWGMTCPPAGYSHAHFRAGGDEVAVPWIMPRIGTYHDAHDVTRAMCEGFADCLHPEARVIGDKWPMLGALHPDGSGRRVWEDLRELWPECRLLWMNRDLEATVRSALRAWPGQKAAVRRAQAFERLEGQGLCEDAYWVQLEHLNARPRSIMEGVLEFANLPAETYPWETFDQHFREGHRVN